jgi:hypothetical protein
MDVQNAEAMALRTLAFLASEEYRISRFMALTGIGLERLRVEAATPELQAATLEYLLSDESLLLAFCQEAGVDPATVAPAHAVLVERTS